MCVRSSALRDVTDKLAHSAGRAAEEAQTVAQKEIANVPTQTEAAHPRVNVAVFKYYVSSE